MYKLEFTKQAQKDVKIAARAGYENQVKEILETVQKDPFNSTQQFERLLGNLKGMCSRRIDYHNRFVYSVLTNTDGLRNEKGVLYEGIVHVVSAWGHNY
ncbi:MAG: Txe/YoeB family addiction module toxin [Chitinispirillales bacterium]|jgi:Txe/YoeB family toxin of toxin-antitoxin system|nr:Txe/YoeB family addiction module toxin [Chitinispirillales bacterium]